MSNKLFLSLLFLFFVIIPIVGNWLYKKKEISNKVLAFFISGSLGLIHFFAVIVLEIFGEKSIMFGGFFMVFYLVIGTIFGMWLLGKVRKIQ